MEYTAGTSTSVTHALTTLASLPLIKRMRAFYSEQYLVAVFCSVYTHGYNSAMGKQNLVMYRLAHEIKIAGLPQV